jgi:ElaB/YqjD/DUF883 family membrane-anchored ribosome-binding protein
MVDQHDATQRVAANGAAGAQEPIWEAYFRAHPWLTCGTAAALGFVVAPRVRHRGGESHPLRPADALPPAIEASAADVAGAGLASDLLKVAAATLAEQSVAQLFGLGREMLERMPKPAADRPSSVAEPPAEIQGAAHVDQQKPAAADVRQSHIEAAIKNVNLAELEERLEHAATSHPMTSLVAAAAVGLVIGLLVKR